MADRGDRGGHRGGRGHGRGRGRESQDGQAGRGSQSGRGDRGGSHSRGGYPDRGGRGDFRVGRGEYRSGRGEYRGGGRGDGGRGDGSRGRGRGRGGGYGGPRRDESPGKSMAFEIKGHDIRPDPAVKALEDRTIAERGTSIESLTTQVSRLGVSASRGGDLFPARPAFGTSGAPTVLWTNYFRVDIRPKVLYKWTMDIAQVKFNEVAEPRKQQKSGGKPGKPSRDASQSQSGAIKGRKLHFVIAELIKEITAQDSKTIVATDFKHQLVSLTKLNMKANPIRVKLLRDDGGDQNDEGDFFDINVKGPIEIPVSDMGRYLTSTQRTPDDDSFPRFPDVIDAMNLIFGHSPRSRIGDISAVGKARFFPFGDQKVIENLFASQRALVAARGFFQSARLATGRLLLNTNVTHGVFKASGRVKDIFDTFGIKAVNKADRGGMARIKAIAKFMPKTRVWVTFNLANGKTVRRPKAIHNLATATDMHRVPGNRPKFEAGYEYAGPKNVQFWNEQTKRWMTVFDHFKEKYGRSLGDYPLINVGRPEKAVFFPAEVVEIQPGQTVKAKLTGDETTTMLDFACRSPHANAVSITTDARTVLGLGDELLDKFGINVDKNLLTVQARVLKSPAVSYVSKDGKQKRVDVIPRDGSWNLRDVRVHKPGRPIDRWSFVNVLMRPNHGAVDSAVVDDFAKFLISMGIKISASPIKPPTETLAVDGIVNGGALDKLMNWLEQGGIRFLVVILSDRADSEVYGKIKYLGDCVYGVHTSCVLSRQFAKASPSYFANVGLKVNLKAGGVNHKLRDDFGLLKAGRTMIAGYDVTHPTNMPTDKDKMPPSIAGLVASIDSECGQWPSVAWEQPSKKEMLGSELREVFESRLKLWANNNGKATPENIVIFRDGVSESQFAQVLDQELPLIREACAKVCPPKKQPNMAIIVSVKRHHTRFYPTSKADMSRSGNIKNGTVVDRGITQARYWDFYLTAHDALKGTARPAHYTVLFDEVFRPKFGDNAANELERLTHELCYLFGRATKAVSICPPAYYADIVCERARAHRPEWFDASDTDSQSTRGQGQGPSSMPDTAGKQVHASLKNTMYYV